MSRCLLTRGTYEVNRNRDVKLNIEFNRLEVEICAARRPVRPEQKARKRPGLFPIRRRSSPNFSCAYSPARKTQSPWWALSRSIFPAISMREYRCAGRRPLLGTSAKVNRAAGLADAPEGRAGRSRVSGSAERRQRRWDGRESAFWRVLSKSPENIPVLFSRPARARTRRLGDYHSQGSDGRREMKWGSARRPFFGSEQSQRPRR